MSVRTVSVLGAGSWGTTLAVLLCGNGRHVTLHARSETAARALHDTRENTKYLPGVKLSHSIAIVHGWDRAAAADMIVLAVPTHAIRETLTSRPVDLRAVLVNTAKGLEEETLFRPSEIVGAASNAGSGRIVSLVGPSHAEEVSRGMPTSVVAAGASQAACHLVQEAFSSATFRVYANPDMVGVEVATALKNVIAIAAGIIDGLGFGDNTKAALVTRGLAEITRLGLAMGASAQTFSGLSGVGDLVVTCLSRHSRNRGLGERLGRGKSLDAALAEMVMVAEGVRTTRAAVVLGQRFGVELPIIETVHRVLFEGASPRDAVIELMTRPLRDEV